MPSGRVSVRKQPLLAALNLMPPALPGDIYSLAIYDSALRDEFAIIRIRSRRSEIPTGHGPGRIWLTF